MSVSLTILSVVGLAYFCTQLVNDPVNWPRYALGVAACGFVLARHRKVAGSQRRVATTSSLHEIQDAETLDRVLGSDRAILYKHSTRCAVSAIVIDEVMRFSEQHPDWKVWTLKVIEQRALSDTVTERLGVRHESPQAFVIRDGRCIWNTSHNGITEERLNGVALSSGCPL